MLGKDPEKRFNCTMDELSEKLTVSMRKQIEAVLEVDD